MSQVTVTKLDERGRPVLNYSGRVLAHTSGCIILEAYLHQGPFQTGPITLNPGDRFVEHYFPDRWYNIFELYDRDDGAFKGWYCNITRPAVIEDGSVSAEDLALDLLVTPEGQQFVLDWDEFNALELAAEERRAALEALAQLQELARTRMLPNSSGR